MGMTSPAMPVAEGILSDTATLAASIEGAHCAFTTLEQRLDPILKPERPTKAGSGSKDSVLMSQERVDINKAIAEVKRLQDRIGELTTRIDL